MKQHERCEVITVHMCDVVLQRIDSDMGSQTPPMTSWLLTAAPELTGGPEQWQLVLPIAGTESLTFSATDPDGDALTWQLAVSGAGQVATGLSYSSAPGKRTSRS